jgi:hypothetical protein
MQETAQDEEDSKIGSTQHSSCEIRDSSGEGTQLRGMEILYFMDWRETETASSCEAEIPYTVKLLDFIQLFYSVGERSRLWKTQKR